MALTKAGKFVIFVIPTVAVLIVGQYLFKNGKIFASTGFKTSKVEGVDLPTAPANAKTTVPQLPISGMIPTAVNNTEFRMEVEAWNVQMGLMYANGGLTTAAGFLMAKNNVNLKLINQNDDSVSAQNIIKFANSYKKDPNTKDGIQFVVDMGDGGAQYIAGINKELLKLGPDYKLEIIGSVGRSNGEDKLMGPVAWRTNPQAAKGALIATVLRQGDWNTTIKWCNDNNLLVNPDEKTYNPNAVNFIGVDDFTKAAALYIAGKDETRPIVDDMGMRTGQTWTGKISGVATWTPADVTVAEQKGGLVGIVSTKQYSSQMPGAIFTVKKFADDHHKEVVDMLDAIFKGGDQVRCYSSALNFAGAVSAKVYADKDGAYWVKYYTGFTEADKQGLNVDLGGSMSWNLADNLNYFGVAPGSVNTFKIVYTTFGTVVSKLYPTIVPTFPAAEAAIDTTFLNDLMQKTPTTEMASAETKTYNAYAISQQVSKKAFSIEFASGSATISPKSYGVLKQIADSAAVSSGLSLHITGHTDNAGTPESNQSLSEQRAAAVKTWLSVNYKSIFPDSRIVADGKGQSEPVADNATPAGKAKNRRVELVMGE